MVPNLNLEVLENANATPKAKQAFCTTLSKQINCKIHNNCNICYDIWEMWRVKSTVV